MVTMTASPRRRARVLPLARTDFGRRCGGGRTESRCAQHQQHGQEHDGEEVGAVPIARMTVAGRAPFAGPDRPHYRRRSVVGRSAKLFHGEHLAMMSRMSAAM